MRLDEWLSGRVFQFVHGNNLVYNTCWEDPRLDRVAMQLSAQDTVLVITSAGCNALDYALEGPAQVHAVDMNPRQNALLELKLAAIRGLDYEDFYSFFGNGYHPRAKQIYAQQLRLQLSPWAADYWDRFIRFFSNPRRPFYFRGTSGAFARMINFYIDHVIHARATVNRLLSTTNLDEQKRLYREQLKDRFWSRSMRFFLGRDTTLSLLGVPRAQRDQVEKDYEGGIVKFMEDCLDAVFGELSLVDNYFWRVYITGKYQPNCCPEYLRPDNYQKLRDGLADRITIFTGSVQSFLELHSIPITRFVLLDHMDWLASHRFQWLESEWQAILQRATPDAKILWRSGGLKTDFVDRVQVQHHGQAARLADLLTYQKQLAEELHAKDRVHTYGSFYIANLAA